MKIKLSSLIPGCEEWEVEVWLQALITGAIIKSEVK
jgi:hypothetical protein